MSTPLRALLTEVPTEAETGVTETEQYPVPMRVRRDGRSSLDRLDDATSSGGYGVAGKAEDLLRHDVALHLCGPTADGQGRGIEEPL
jgi:hypothetical protein